MVYIVMDAEGKEIYRTLSEARARSHFSAAAGGSVWALAIAEAGSGGPPPFRLVPPEEEHETPRRRRLVQEDAPLGAGPLGGEAGSPVGAALGAAGDEGPKDAE